MESRIGALKEKGRTSSFANCVIALEEQFIPWREAYQKKFVKERGVQCQEIKIRKNFQKYKN